LSEDSLKGKKLQTIITLEYDDKKTADAVAKAVSPDNFKAPKGLTVQTKQENNVVITHINLTGKLATLIATIDDLLENASTAEKTLRVLKQQK
jgi:hypothetical protein